MQIVWRDVPEHSVVARVNLIRNKFLLDCARKIKAKNKWPLHAGCMADVQDMSLI